MQPATTIRDLAATSLAAVRVFEKYGIDYCCGGKRPLTDACVEKGFDPAAVQNELDAAMAGSPVSDRDWNSASAAELVGHIVSTHHEYLRRELPALETRLEKVYRVYNQRNGPTLIGLPDVFAGLKAELESHMMKEEMILFPVIAGYEASQATGQPVPHTCFGTVAQPIAMMEHEHDSAGEALARIREITGNFQVPEFACVTYRALMTGLAELEQDLHMHIHLENNILFPRAQQMEASLR
jgi:regulator of cell morphogenesis and NO signaling